MKELCIDDFQVGDVWCCRNRELREVLEVRRHDKPTIIVGFGGAIKGARNGKGKIGHRDSTMDLVELVSRVGPYEPFATGTATFPAQAHTCTCPSLLAGHEASCAFFKAPEAERTRLENVWGIVLPEPAPECKTASDNRLSIRRNGKSIVMPYSTIAVH